MRNDRQDETEMGHATNPDSGNWQKADGESHPEPAAADGRKLLVAMVHTLAGPSAFSYLHGLASETQTSFHIMMPVLRPDYGLTWTESQARKDADARLSIMLEFMTRAGFRVSGETRLETPPQALEEVVTGPAGPFDGIVVVWRQKKHRWLYRSKSERFEDAFGIPVVAIRADPPLRHSNIEDPAELREVFEAYARREGLHLA